jgi:hypothetical protein
MAGHFNKKAPHRHRLADRAAAPEHRKTPVFPGSPGSVIIDGNLHLTEKRAGLGAGLPQMEKM